MFGLWIECILPLDPDPRINVLNPLSKQLAPTPVRILCLNWSEEPFSRISYEFFVFLFVCLILEKDVSSNQRSRRISVGTRRPEGCHKEPEDQKTSWMKQNTKLGKETRCAPLVSTPRCPPCVRAQVNNLKCFSASKKMWSSNACCFEGWVKTEMVRKQCFV